MKRGTLPVLGLLLVAGGVSGLTYGFDAKLASQPAASGTQKVDSATFGYAVNPNGPELRAVLGVPGACRFSDPLTLPDGTSAIDLAPGHRWALLTRASSLTAFDPATGSAVDLPSGIPDAYAFSPSGTRIALFYAASGSVQIFKGLPANPVLDSTTSIAAADAIAVSDISGFVYSAAGTVNFNPGAGQDQFLYQTAALGPFSFEAGNSSLVLFDADAGSLLELGTSTNSSRTIAVGFGNPDKLFAWSDHIAAADSSSNSLWIIDTASGAFSQPQSSPVSRISPMQLQDVLLLSFDSGQPAWIAAPQGISFVPALQ